jgi:hypothetical protein
VTVPVPAPPEPVTARPQVIGQTMRGLVFAWATVAIGCVAPLALLERAWGVKGQLADQAWIIPAGLLGAAATLSAYRFMIPKRGRAQLVVAPDRLEYRDPAAAPVILERPTIGLVDVLGSTQSGEYLVKVHDHESTVIARWSPRWSGWREERVVAAFLAAGYPAARHRDIYDGRFQSQTPGQPPRMAH